MAAGSAEEAWLFQNEQNPISFRGADIREAIKKHQANIANAANDRMGLSVQEITGKIAQVQEGMGMAVSMIEDVKAKAAKELQGYHGNLADGMVIADKTMKKIEEAKERLATVHNFFGTLGHPPDARF